MAQVVVAMSKNNPPPSDPTPMEPTHNAGDNPHVPYTTTKIQPCDLELAFESIDPIVVNIIDSKVSHGNLVVIFSLKPFKNLLHVIYFFS